ncbi:MAG: tetratricopeptide repeat protein [Flavobacteriales bacterium]
MNHSKPFLFLVTFLTSMFSVAQTPEAQFEMGNGAYKVKDFETALEAYKNVEQAGFESPELYFNMGNTAHQLQQLGYSILYYEKALELDPNFEEAQKNLAFVEQFKADKIEQVPLSIFKTFFTEISSQFTVDQWFNISIWALLLFCIGVFALSFQWIKAKRKPVFFLNLMALAFALFAIGFTIYSHQNQKQLLVFVGDTVYVKSEPNTESVDLFLLHEGVKAEVKAKDGNWLNIRLEDGLSGWVKVSDFEEI